MLQNIRDHFHGWFFRIILGALILVFAAWGAYGIVDVGFGAVSYAAKVDGDKITLDEANRFWRQQQARYQQMFNGEIPEAQRKLIQDSLLEEMIRGRLLTDRARDLGYRVTDEQLRNAIAQLPAFQIEGKYSPDAAKARLAMEGMTPQSFERDMRLDLERDQVESAIRVSNFVTPAEIEHALALENEQREVRYAVLPPEKFVAADKVGDAAIQAYYEKHQADYMNPESARVKYAELRVDQVASQSAVTDEEVRAAYTKQQARYVTAEKRRARHILIKVADPKGDAAARAKAEQVLAEVKSGKDFGELAKKYSEDGGSAAQGGDLGWAERNYFVGPFADAVFSMKEGEIRGPVKTEFGYHILRLDGIEAGKSKTLEEARPDIEAQLRKDHAADRFGDIQEALQAKLEQPNTDIDALANEFHLATGEVANFGRGAGGAPLGATPELQSVVFSPVVADQGRVGGPVALGEDRLVIVKVLSHKAAAPKPLAEVRAAIAAAIAREQGTAAARAAAEAAVKRLDAGESFEAVAKASGATAEPARFVGRTDPSIAAPIRRAVFESPKPAAGKPVNRVVPLDTGGAAIVAVSAVRTDDPKANPALIAQRAQELRRRRDAGDFAAYLEEMRARAKVEKNPKAFE